MLYDLLPIAGNFNGFLEPVVISSMLGIYILFIELDI